MLRGRWSYALPILILLQLDAARAADCTAAGPRTDAPCTQSAQDFFGEVPEEEAAPAAKPATAKPVESKSSETLKAQAPPPVVAPHPAPAMVAAPEAKLPPEPAKQLAQVPVRPAAVAPVIAVSPVPVKPVAAVAAPAPVIAVTAPKISAPPPAPPTAAAVAPSVNNANAVAPPASAANPARREIVSSPANAAAPSAASQTLPTFFREGQAATANNGAADDMVIHESRRVALVIGNGNYPNAPLKNAPNDAELMAHTLESLGFEVMSKTNANQREMKALISEFGARIRRGGVGLFYYAGHGLQIDGENYLIPTDAQIEQEADVDAWGVNVTAVLKQMGKADNHLNLVILDACRDNPFARSWRGGARGLAELEAPVGTYIAYATAPGQTASDGDGSNGLYTEALTTAMETPGARLEDIFMNTRRAVRARSGGKQVPWENGSLTGVFYFNDEGMPAQTQVASARPPLDSGRAENRELLELAVWGSVKASTRKEDLALYLEKFPKGHYADEAKKRIAYLDTPVALIDAATPGAYLETRGLPLLDATVPHKFGNWTILRKPSRSRIRVLPVGAGKLPEVQTQSSAEDYYFYYEPLLNVAAALHIEDGDDAIAYRNEKTTVALRSCRRTGGASVPLRKDLDFSPARDALPLAVPANYAVWFVADKKEDSDRKIRVSAAGDLLEMRLPDKTITLKADDPSIEMMDLEAGTTCRFR
jgi:hypothetical protein